MRNRIARQARFLFFAGLGLICVLLPFQPRFMASVEIATVFFFLIGFHPKMMTEHLRRNYRFLPYLFLFATVVFWQFFSVDQTEAARQTEVKLAFFIIPVLLAGSGIRGRKAEDFIRLFVWSCLAATLFLIGRSAWYAYTSLEKSVLFYTDFSYFIHVTYFSLYLLFSAGWLLMKGLNNHARLPFRYAAAIAIFFLGVFFCASKMMILAAIFSAIIMAVYYSVKTKNLVPALVLIISALFIPIALYRFSDNFKLRVDYGITELRQSEENRDPEKIGSTGLRVVVWKRAMPLIAANLPWGIGPGNVQIKLQDIYKEEGMQAAENRKLNMHNEFLQQALGTGVIGLLILPWLIFLPWFASRKSEKLAGLLFSFLVFSACLAESILERQAGTLFVALLGVLLVLAYGKIPEERKV